MTTTHLPTPAPFDRTMPSLRPLRARLLGHAMYASVASAADLRVFLEHHVFAVWDFMSLVKAVQRQVTCVDVPWVPSGDPASRRFINEIVLGEESDEDDGGAFISHFELYVAAMREAGARTGVIDDFVARIRRREPVDASLEASGAPAAARAFVRSTFRIVEGGSLPAIAAALTLGREDVIPDMFRALVVRLDEQSKSPQSAVRFALLRRYLERHVDLDESRHAPMARRMLASVCGDDPARWREAESAARESLEARIRLWDGVQTEMRIGHGS